MWILDAKIYIRAFNEAAFGAELRKFHAANLPRIILSSVAVFELLAACRNAGAERRLRKGLLEPYRSRGRIHVPTCSTWEMAAHLHQRLRKRRGAEKLVDSARPQDLLLAASACQIGATMVSEDGDLATIARVLDLRCALPWP